MTIKTLLQGIWGIIMINWLIFFCIFNLISPPWALILVSSGFIPLYLQDKLPHEILNKKLF